MKLAILHRQMTLRGEFQGRAFTADYSSDDGWNAGNGVECLDSEFVESDDYDAWSDELYEYLWNNTCELLGTAE